MIRDAAAWTGVMISTMIVIVKVIYKMIPILQFIALTVMIEKLISITEKAFHKCGRW